MFSPSQKWFPFEFIEFACTLGFVGKPYATMIVRKLLGCGLCLEKVCESLEVTSRPTTSDWAPNSCGRLTENNMSLRGVRVSFVVWYVSNVFIIFDWSILVLWCCHMFSLSYYIIFMHFVGLTYWQDAQCQFPVFVLILLQKVTSENILGIGQKFTTIFLLK